MSVFDVTTADDWARTIQGGINAPLVSVKKSTLGGPNNVSILFTVALAKKEDWPNGILENSTYFRMHLLNDGELDMFSGHVGSAKKFRKVRVTRVDEVVARVNKYIADVQRTMIASELLKTAKSLLSKTYPVVLDKPEWDKKLWREIEEVAADLFGMYDEDEKGVRSNAIAKAKAKELAKKYVGYASVTRDELEKSILDYIWEEFHADL